MGEKSCQGKRMSFVKGQELLNLAMIATRRSGVSLEDIVDESDCSHRTAQRMTDALQAASPRRRSRLARIASAAGAFTPRSSRRSDPVHRGARRLVLRRLELEVAGMTVEAAALSRLQSKVRSLLQLRTGTRLAVDEEALLEVLGHAAWPGPRPARTSASMLRSRRHRRRCCRVGIPAHQSTWERTTVRRSAPSSRPKSRSMMR